MPWGKASLYVRAITQCHRLLGCNLVQPLPWELALTNQSLSAYARASIVVFSCPASDVTRGSYHMLSCSDLIVKWPDLTLEYSSAPLCDASDMG
jgi:hypothetical protein